MNYSKAVFLINDNVRAISATYEAGENAPRTIFKTFDQTLAKDDFILVPTNTRHNMTVCKIIETDVEVDLESGEKVEWVIGKVNLADHQKMLAMEEAAIETIKSAEKAKKRRELREALMADSQEQLKALPIAQVNAEPTPEPKTQE